MENYFSFFILFSVVVISWADPEALNCVKCNSTDNPNCAQKPELIKEKEECKGEDYRCIVLIDKQATIRKCGKQGDCKKGDENCQECGKAEECAKIYPENRPQCIQWEGKEGEDDKNLPSSLPCVTFDKNDDCFSIVKDNKTIRGCMSDEKRSTVCKENKEICKTCKYTEKDKECNKDIGTQTVKCLKCSGKECQKGNNCKIDEKFLEDCKTLYGRESCYILRQGNEVSRGCLNGFNPPATGLLEKCPKENKERDRCNSKCIEDVKCPICESTKNPKCVNEQFASSDCPEYTSACYWCEDEAGVTYRGCGNGNNTFTCSYGYGEPAKKPNLSCYVCGKDDPNCATVEKDLTARECKLNNDSCVVMIADDYTIRGCASEVLGDKRNECTEDNFCYSCEKHRCNGKIYPVNRQKCYQCSKCNTLEGEKKVNSKPCVLYKPNEKCYTYADNNDMYRGCVSDKSFDDCKKNKEKCINCEIDNCNNSPPSKDASLKCMKCENNKECQWAQSKTSAVTCTGTVNFWQKETCFTYQLNATLVTRGCTIRSQLCEDNDSPQCEKCEGDSCNRKNLMPFTCIRCRSDNPGEKNCATSLEGQSTNPFQSKCANLKDMQYTDKGCYTRKLGAVIIRGCLIDLSPDIREKCKNKDYKYCTHCPDANCNNQKPPNSSGSQQASFALLCLLLILVIRID